MRAHVAPLPEVQEFCEARALGCYGANTLVSIGDPVDGVTAEEVMRHEYGHHVAANRQNPPWAAIDWGTKRWASAADVCTRVAGLTAFPGDEGLYYSQNPGEAFAEAYRVLNEVHGGSPQLLVDARRRQLHAGRAWSSRLSRTTCCGRGCRPRFEVVAGRLRAGARAWTQSIATPLDGELVLSLRMPLGAGHTRSTCSTHAG